MLERRPVGKGMKRLRNGLCLAMLAFTASTSVLAQGPRYDAPPRREAAANAPDPNPSIAAKVSLGKRLFFDTSLSTF